MLMSSGIRQTQTAYTNTKLGSDPAIILALRGLRQEILDHRVWLSQGHKDNEESTEKIMHPIELLK